MPAFRNRGDALAGKDQLSHLVPSSFGICWSSLVGVESAIVVEDSAGMWLKRSGSFECMPSSRSVNRERGP